MPLLLDFSARKLIRHTKPFEDAPLIGCNARESRAAQKIHRDVALSAAWTIYSRALLAKISGLHEPISTVTILLGLLLRGRSNDRAISIISTAPHASQTFSASTRSPSLESPTNPRVNVLSQQPEYPSLSAPDPVVTIATEQRQHKHHQIHPVSSSRSLQSRKASSASSAATYRPWRLPAAHLWNPTNSTPRISARPRKRRPSTPTGPPILLQHPALDKSTNTTDARITGAGDYPLLTLSEQRQSRHHRSPRTSYQIERTGSDNRRVSLPQSVRASYDGGRSQIIDSFVNPFRVDKGKSKATMAPESEEPRRSYSRDLERGPDIMDHRLSNVSAGDGIGSAISSSNSSIMGEEVQPDLGESWGPQHPCYPHLNPHVPMDSAEYVTTRIIRIRRDWLLQGDLAPTFSNLYPEILDPAGVSEPEFRRIIDKLNRELVPAFDPYNARNLLDSLLGLVTGWLWDDFGMTSIKTRLNNLEKWIDKWNLEMEKTMSSSEDGALPPKLVSLRRTGYMTLDIQIPDPEIAPAPSSTGGGESRTALPLEPAPALIV